MSSPAGLIPRRGTAVGTLIALAWMALAADQAAAQSFLRRAFGEPAGQARAAAAVPGPSARRSDGGRAPATSLPPAAAASPASARGSGAPAAAAKRAAPTAPAVVRAGSAAAQPVAGGEGVVQAGHLVASTDCRHCGRRGCDACRPGAGRIAQACNGRCDAGGCPAHCPVRPEQFGYYPTQWRSWPGQGVRQVAHFDPATTPVVPPRSQFPTIDEEGGAAPEEDAGAEAPPARAPLDAATVPAPGGRDAPADMPAPAGEVPEADAAPEASDATGDAAEGESAAIRAVAPHDAASALLSPRRAAPRPTGAWRPAPGPRDGRDEGAATPAPSNGDGAAATPRAAAAPGNPLRAAERRSGIEAADSRPRAVAAEGWRPTRRAAPGDASETTLRGVTANPGNPLR